MSFLIFRYFIEFEKNKLEEDENVNYEYEKNKLDFRFEFRFKSKNLRNVNSYRCVSISKRSYNPHPLTPFCAGQSVAVKSYIPSTKQPVLNRILDGL